MDFYNKVNWLQDKKEALLDFTTACGTVDKYAELFGVSRSRGSNWKINPNFEIPSLYAFLHEIFYGIPLERLVLKPAYRKIIALFRKHYTRVTPIVFNHPLETIVIPQRLHCQTQFAHHAIIIATDRKLITGLVALNSKKDAHATHVSALMIDAKSLLLEKRTLKAMNPHPFLSTEKLWIYKYLKEFIDYHEKHHTPLGRKILGLKPRSQVSSIWGKAKSQAIDQVLAERLGFDNTSVLERAHQIVERGVLVLIEAFDQGHIEIDPAFEIAQLSSDKQETALSTYLKFSLSKGVKQR